MNQNASIGEKIKALRTSQNMTLKQLSEKTNLSTGFLSQMERGMSSIAIDTLENIAGVLGVSLTSFFDEEPVKDISDPVVHSFALPAVQVGPQIIQHILSHDVSSFDFLPRILPCFHLPTQQKKIWKCIRITARSSSIFWKALPPFRWVLPNIRCIRVTVSRFIPMKVITG